MSSSTDKTKIVPTRSAPKFTEEERERNIQAWLDYLSHEPSSNKLYCLVLNRYSPDVLSEIKALGLPIPERGSISSQNFQTLQETALKLLLEKLTGLSLEELKIFVKQLTPKSKLGDVGQVSGDFPNYDESKAKYHTCPLHEVRLLLNGLLPELTKRGCQILKTASLKVDGSCVLLEGGKLIYPGSRKHIDKEVETRISSLTKSLKKLGDSITDKMPEKVKQQKEKELNEIRIFLAYFELMLSKVKDIEKSGHEGETFEIFLLGTEMNDLTSALFPIMTGMTIVPHTHPSLLVEIPEACDVLSGDSASILTWLNQEFEARCSTAINPHLSPGSEPFKFVDIDILNGTKKSSVCEGLVIHIRVIFPDERTVFNMRFKVKNPEMNMEPSGSPCVFSGLLTKEIYHSMLSAMLFPKPAPAVKDEPSEPSVPQESEPESSVPKAEPETSVPKAEPESSVPKESEPESSVPHESEPESSVPQESEPSVLVSEQ